jgi:hypothetical protein
LPLPAGENPNPIKRHVFFSKCKNTFSFSFIAQALHQAPLVCRSQLTNSKMPQSAISEVCKTFGENQFSSSLFRDSEDVKN